MLSYFLVFVGGGFGSLCRFLVTNALIRYQLNFPFATLVSNVLSSLILGMLIGMFWKGDQLPGKVQYFLAIGFCGGFSTFSTFTSENWLLIQRQDYSLAFLNILTSVVLCLASIYGGIKIMQSV